jgi:hypothetical protein
MAEDPKDVIRRLTESLQQQRNDNAALREVVARQKRQIARLEAQRNALVENVRAAFATATAYVADELPKQLEPVLAELRRLQDEEWLRTIGEVDPAEGN